MEEPLIHHWQVEDNIRTLFRNVAISLIFDKNMKFADSFIEMASKNLADYYYVHLNDLFLNVNSHYDLKSAILDARRKKFKKLLYVEVGNLLDWHINFFRAVRGCIDNSDIKFMGHILDYGNGSFYIHPQMFLIDVDWAYENEVFTIEPEDKEIEWKGRIVERSEENFHDNYTPTWVKGTKSKKRFKGRGLGYNIINKLAETSVEFMPFPETVRKEKAFLYPSVKSEAPTQKAVLTKRSTPSKAYVANTEVIKWEYLTNDKPFDTIVSPASGIIPLVLGYKNKASTIIVYDFSLVALAFYETLLEKWDGRNYKDFISNNFNIKSEGKGVYLGSEWLTSDDQTIKELGEDFVTWFLENKKNIVTSRFDLYDKTTWRRLFGYIHNEKNIFFNLSNILHYFPTSIIFSTEEKKEIFEMFLNEINKRNLLEEIYFFGANPFQITGFNNKINKPELIIKYQEQLIWRKK